MKVNLEQAQGLTGELKFASYAALDTTGTMEIFRALEGRLNAEQRRTYRWSLKQLAPSLAMTLRGIRIDGPARESASKRMEAEKAALEARIKELPAVVDLWDGWELETGYCETGGKTSAGNQRRHKWPRSKPGEMALPTETMQCLRCLTPRRKRAEFSPSSQEQVKHLLFELHKMPHCYDKEGKLTSNEEALQRLTEKESPRKWKGTRELCASLINHRDLVKQLGFLRAKLSPSGRFHASFNVAAAWTGRWSSSKDPFGIGSNLQNVAEQHRHIFLADPEMTIFYADLKTAESLHVAYLAGDENYIRAHEGDVHTYVCRLLWPDLPWTGDIQRDKKLASSTLPDWDSIPGHDLRFQSKRVQHGSNYGLSPYGIARIARIPVQVAAQAQGAYYKAFPNIPEWQKATIARVKGQLPLYNALQRVVWLMGRPWDDHTHKQGLAFGPQGGIGDVLNIGLFRLWQDGLQLLAQVHDAVLGQFPDEWRGAEQRIREQMTVPTLVTDIFGVTRSCTIPTEVAVGKNWGKRGPENPNGLVVVQ